MIIIHEDQVVAAREGDRAALDALVRAAQRPIYNLSLRMLADPNAAEDATQEILIKVITSLGALRDPGAAGGWALRIACRHLVETRKQSRTETMRLNFEGFAEDLDRGQAPLVEAGLAQVEEAIALEQIKIGCTLALLTCLSRKMRIAYILGEIFELSDAEAAKTIDISQPAYRQRLARARAAVLDFTRVKCGVASPKGNCHCSRRVVPALKSGRIGKDGGIIRGDAGKPFDLQRLQDSVQRLESGRAAAALMRSNPNFSIEHLPHLVRTLKLNLGSELNLYKASGDLGD